MIAYNDLTQAQQFYLGLRREAILARDGNKLVKGATLNTRARDTALKMTVEQARQGRQIANTLIDLWFLFRWMRLQS